MDLEYASNQSHIFGPSTPKTLGRGTPPDEPVAAPHATQHETPDEDSICYECRQVDWDSLTFLARNLEKKNTTRKFRMIRTIKANYEELAVSSCKICRIFSVVMPRSLDQTVWYVGACPLWTTSEYYLPFHLGKKRNITTIHVRPVGENTLEETSVCKYLAVIKDGEGSSSRTIPPRSIDYHWLKLLAQLCEKDHKGHCRLGSLYPISVPGLKVIKVSSRTVIEAPAECRYVALSYVWGKQPDVGPTLHLQRPPPLIEDAISVTIAMGYEYLWIDRYCIPHADDQEKHRMIKQMDQIYSNASLTIIDASGVDTQSGIPGVSSFARRLQKFVRIRNTVLLEMSAGPHELYSSKWATRGWTYQELYLSTRRLIFTPSQVLFLCNSTLNVESIYHLLQPDRPGGLTVTQRLKHLIPGFGTVDAMQLEPRLPFQVQEYSQRELTYPSDSLNAFLGVLNSHAPTPGRPTSPFLHIAWGLIVRKKLRKHPCLVYLNWYHEAPAVRRPELPSWTWAGWGGPVVMPDDEGIPLPKRGDYSFPLPHLDTKVFCEPEGQKPVEIRDFVNVLSKTVYTGKLQPHRQLTYLKQLHVTCLVVPIHFQKNPLKEAQSDQGTEIHVENKSGFLWVERLDSAKENVAVVNLCKGIYVAIAPYLDQDSDQDLEKQDDVIGLLFTRKDYPGFITIGCLLARPLDGVLYERVGTIPYVMFYPQDDRIGYYCLKYSKARLIFLDEAGSVLDEIRLPERQRELPFNEAGERRTIVLV